MSALLQSKKLEFSSEPVGAWPAQPFQLISLFDMHPFLADIFYFAVYHLDAFECEIKQASASEDRGKDSPMTPEEIERARVRLRTLESRCSNLQLARTVEHLGDIEAQFAVFDLMPEYPVSLRKMEDWLDHLQRCLARDLGSQTFMTIPASDIGYYEQDQLFGPEVFNSFFTTRDDVKEGRKLLRNWSIHSLRIPLRPRC